MAPSKQINFRAGSYSITIDPPLFGYKTKILLPFEIQSLDDGKYSIFDAGQVYDSYQCECTFELDATSQGSLSEFLQSSAQGRGNEDVVMTLQNGTGFFPFSPYRGDSGTYSVAIIDPVFKGIGPQPWQYFHTEVTIINQGVFPAYTLPDDISDGNWKFGDVVNVAFPQGWFDPDTRYRYDSTLLKGGTVKIIDRGSTCDRYNTSFKLISNEEKTGRILQDILSTHRSNSFEITTQAGYYALGHDWGDNGEYTVQLIDDEINIVHERHNRFLFELQLTMVENL